MTTLHVAMLSTAFRGDPVIDRFRLYWWDLAKIPVRLGFESRGTPAWNFTLCLVFAATCTACAITTRALFVSLLRRTRLDAVAVRWKAFSSNLPSRISQAGTSSLAWQHCTAYFGFGGSGVSVTEIDRVGGPNTISRFSKKRVHVVFAMKTYAALNRIAARQRGELSQALRKSIMLTDFLDTAVGSGARVLIEHDGVMKELVL
jgi:hypothetical protein